MTDVRFTPPPAVTIVTGASGWLGSGLMAALTDPAGPWRRAGELRPVVRNRSEADRLTHLPGDIRPVIADLRVDADAARVFDDLHGDVDVIHAAGVIHPARLADFATVNVGATRRLLQSAAAHGIRRFVHVSSNSPFGTNPSPGDYFRADEPYAPYYGYGRSKMEAELAVFDAIDAGLDAVIVRPPWFYGPYQPPRQTTFFKMVRAGVFPIMGSGDQHRSMVYLENLADGVVRAELVDEPSRRAWWVADARPYTVREIAETVGQALADEGFDVAPQRVRVPEVVGRFAERADALVQRSGRYHQQIHVLGEMNKNIACSIDETRRDLGYTADIDLYDGMRASIRWCREQGYEL